MGDEVLEHEENMHKKVKSALRFDSICLFFLRKLLQKTLSTLKTPVDKNKMYQTLSVLVTPETLVFPQEL